VRAQQHYHVPAGHKEALGFVAAPQNTNRNTITEQTPDEKFQLTQIGGPNKHHTRRDSKQR
jgi:hypothetical protein